MDWDKIHGKVLRSAHPARHSGEVSLRLDWFITSNQTPSMNFTPQEISPGGSSRGGEREVERKSHHVWPSAGRDICMGEANNSFRTVETLHHLSGKQCLKKGRRGASFNIGTKQTTCWRPLKRGDILNCRKGNKDERQTRGYLIELEPVVTPSQSPKCVVDTRL